MKKKIAITFIVSVVILICLVTFWYFKYVYGWQRFNKNTDTAAEFLSLVDVSKTEYESNKELLLHSLQRQLHLHKDFFESPAYSDSTTILIDTIAFSPNFNKMAILVIVQNHVEKVSQPISSHPGQDFYYNATGYIALKRSDSLILKWVGPNFEDSYNKKEISQYLRDGCFRTFVNPQSNEDFYNMNDKRFWTCEIWRSIEK